MKPTELILKVCASVTSWLKIDFFFFIIVQILMALIEYALCSATATFGKTAGGDCGVTWKRCIGKNNYNF